LKKTKIIIHDFGIILTKGNKKSIKILINVNKK